VVLPRSEQLASLGELPGVLDGLAQEQVAGARVRVAPAAGRILAVEKRNGTQFFSESCWKGEVDAQDTTSSGSHGLPSGISACLPYTDPLPAGQTFEVGGRELTDGSGTSGRSPDVRVLPQVFVQKGA
jgi:hypothetical protein